MTKDPLRVTYNDMIADTEEKLKWMKKTFPGRVIAGKMSQWHATHRIEMEKTKLKVFQALKGLNAKFIIKNNNDEKEASNKKEGSEKKNKRQYHEFFFINDPNISRSNLIMHDQDDLIEHLKYYVLDNLFVGDEVQIKIGKTQMTERQFNNLKDLED